MGREFELKFRADAEAIAAVEKAYGPFLEITMETIYYDTPDRDLRRLHWTVRRRLENGIPVCTVKTPASGGGRGEWEVPCEDILKAIPLLMEQGASAEIWALAQKGLTPVCGARFTRLAALVSRTECTVELALDRGVLLGGNRELPFAEIEVELKQGGEAEAVSFAQSLAREFCLHPEPKSKLQRAMEL